MTNFLGNVALRMNKVNVREIKWLRASAGIFLYHVENIAFQ